MTPLLWGGTASEWQSQDLNLSPSALDPGLLVSAHSNNPHSPKYLSWA